MPRDPDPVDLHRKAWEENSSFKDQANHHHTPRWRLTCKFCMTTKFSGGVKAGSLRKRSKQGQQWRRTAIDINQMNIRPLLCYFSSVLLEFPNLVYKRGEWAREMALQLRTLSVLTDQRAGSQHPYIIQGFLEPSKVIRMRRRKLKLRECMWTGGGIKSSWAISIYTKREAVVISLLFIFKADGRAGDIVQLVESSCRTHRSLSSGYHGVN